MNISENTSLWLKGKIGGLLKYYSLRSRRLNHTSIHLLTLMNSKMRKFCNIRKAHICSLEHCPNSNGLNLPVIWVFSCEIQKYRLKVFWKPKFFLSLTDIFSYSCWDTDLPLAMIHPVLLFHTAAISHNSCLFLSLQSFHCEHSLENKPLEQRQCHARVGRWDGANITHGPVLEAKIPFSDPGYLPIQKCFRVTDHCHCKS